MALRDELTKRLFRLCTTARSASSLIPRREYVSPPDAASRGFFQRFLQRRAINQASLTPARIPQSLAMSLGETMIGGMEINRPSEVENMRRMLRLAQVEMVKEKLRSAEKSTVTYAEYVDICIDACRSRSQGMEIAKILDESANVVVWGNVVFLLPHKVAKSMEALLRQSVGLPDDDPRKKELEEMDEQKAQIDEEARSLVRKELYCGLGLLMAQTVGFMRLTFWELSWDVMEPICFFVSSIHFGLAYAFFLGTSTEPTFEGYFKRRFLAKQSKLMKARKFDVQKYEKLCNAFYPPPYA